MQAVRFTKHYDVYNAGEIAGFLEAKAQQLIDLGVAAAHIDRVPATIEEIEQEVAARGYKGEALKQIVEDRFNGVYGEEARYLHPESDDDGPSDEEVAESIAEQVEDLGGDGVLVIPDGATEKQVQHALDQLDAVDVKPGETADEIRAALAGDTKAQIVEKAKVYGLTLNVNDKKDDLIEAVVTVLTAKPEANG